MSLPTAIISPLGQKQRDTCDVDFAKMSREDLEQFVKKCTIVMGCYDWGLTCELSYSETNNDMLVFTPMNDCPEGYISWFGIEFVVLYNDNIVIRKSLNDEQMFQKETCVPFASPIVPVEDLQLRSCYVEHVFDGFDGVNVKLFIIPSWLQSIANSASLIVLD